MSLSLLGWLENKGWQLKSDGSISISGLYIELINRGVAVPDNNDVIFSEYASPVFTKTSALYAHLKRFTRLSYAYNGSCGLHLHIGVGKIATPGGIKRLRLLLRAITDWEFIRGLEKEAVSWCDCMPARLGGSWASQYYKLFGTAKSLLLRKYRAEKYSFMAYHPQGTLEFRFLPPCRHMVANVKRLIARVREQVRAHKTKRRAFLVPKSTRTAPLAMFAPMPLDLSRSLQITIKKPSNGEGIIKLRYQIPKERMNPLDLLKWGEWLRMGKKKSARRPVSATFSTLPEPTFSTNHDPIMLVEQ